MTYLPSKDDVTRRANLMSRALADAARRGRFSTRSRHSLASGGFQARRGARFMRQFIITSLILLVVLPAVASTIYFGLIASDQYVAEAKFTVMGGEPPKTLDGDSVGAVTGIPLAAIIQNTYVVTNYLESRALVEALDAKVGLRRMYERSSVDFLSRFSQEESIERLIRYWRSMCKVSISMPAGIVDLRVRAFTPQDAHKIAEAVVELSEQLINDLNIRMISDIVSNAEAEVRRSSNRLSQARLKLERARNEEGILDTTRAAEALEKLLVDLRAGLLQMQQEYQAMLKAVSATAPQMQALKTRIDAARAQVVELESKLTAVRAGSERTLSASMTRFAELDLERQIAERLYAGAIATLEAARVTSEMRMMYLKTFVLPRLPEEALYPRRILYPSLVLVAGFAAWSLLIGLAVLARNNMG